MARPLKDGLTYFQHDVNMSADEKLEALEALHGNDGYAVFNKLLERIYKNFGHLDLSDDVQRLSIARKCNVSTDKFNQIIEDAVRFRLFDSEPWNEEKLLTSERIRSQVGIVEQERDKWRKKVGGDNPQKEELSNGITPVISGDNPSYLEGKRHKAEQSRAEQKNIRAEQSRAEDTPPAAAAVFSVKEIEGALRLCHYAGRISTGDKLIIAQRMSELGLDLGFVGYCLERTTETHPRNPGGFLRSALIGAPGFEDYPAQYREARPPPEPERPPHPVTCGDCGSPLRGIDKEWVCKNCGAAWGYDHDFGIWEQTESYVPIEEAQG
jgi:hypothetical protein